MQLRHIPCGLFQNQTPALLDLPSGPRKARVQDGPHVKSLAEVPLHLADQFVVTMQRWVSGLKSFCFVNEQLSLMRRNV